MRILILNQAFYPDVVSTAQHASDLAVELAERAHAVTVLSSRRAYDNSDLRFPKSEIWGKVNIIRVSACGFGKKSRWRRALDFGSFFVNCAIQLFRLPRFDVVVVLTSPPLISLLAAWFVKIKGGKFVFWVMDLNPDEAIVAGWLSERSPLTRCLNQGLLYSLLRAEKIVALDRFMRERIARKGVPYGKIEVIPPWSHDNAVRYDEKGREAFRAQHGISNRFVVMYSGNHSPCHPLDTLLHAAWTLSNHPEIVFCFIGGGTEFKKVQLFARERDLKNIICLPYQPLDKLSSSLSAADLHTVVLGDAFVGTVHPCKVYNILALGIPILYIGPSTSHITDMVTESPGNWAYVAQHGEADPVAAHVLRAASEVQRKNSGPHSLAVAFSQDVLLRRIVQVVEGADADEDTIEYAEIRNARKQVREQFRRNI